jgi:hypothetical protein
VFVVLELCVCQILCVFYACDDEWMSGTRWLYQQIVFTIHISVPILAEFSSKTAETRTVAFLLVSSLVSQVMAILDFFQEFFGIIVQ